MYLEEVGSLLASKKLTSYRKEIEKPWKYFTFTDRKDSAQNSPLKIGPQNVIFWKGFAVSVAICKKYYHGFHITVLSPKVKAIYLDIKQIVVVTIEPNTKRRRKCEKPLLHY